jgi:N-acetylmuramoyl-L-alanine amidase
MQRRNFLKYLALLFSAIIYLPESVKSAVRQVFIKGTKNIRIYSKAEKIDTVVPFIRKWDHIFIPVEDFAQAMHYGLYTNEEKKKCVLYIARDRITFTANNTFIKVNDELVQVPMESIWEDGEVWAPLTYFIPVMSKYSALFLQYDESGKKISVEPNDINISEVQIFEKENGTLIRVSASKKFSEKDIVLDIRNNYFHIDVYGGKINPERFATISGAGIISKVEGIQLGETASLVFKLKGDILSRDLVLNGDSNDFYVNLRTRESLSDEESDREKLKQELESQRKRWMIDTIVLDAGHGGKDPGAIGYSKSKEKDLVLLITLKLGKIINKHMPDVRVVYTRQKDVFIPLWKRTKIANDVDAKLFVSIHCNASTSRRPNGFETFFLSSEKDEKAKDVVLKENSAIEFEESHDQKRYEGLNFILATMLQSVNVKRSQFLATNIQTSLESKLKKLGMTNRGVKQGPFWVLVGATMPNVLVESGYLSNRHEEKLLKKNTTQQKIAAGIFAGIQKYKAEIEEAS